MLISHTPLGTDIDSFFELLFLDDDWILNEIPSSGGGWQLLEMQPQKWQSNRFLVVYRKPALDNEFEYMGVDLDSEKIHQICWSRDFN